MATYIIDTTDEHEDGIDYNYARMKEPGQTREQFLRYRIMQVLDALASEPKRKKSVQLAQSLGTIPPEKLAAIQDQIRDLITSHGGTIVSPIVDTQLPPAPDAVPGVGPDGNPFTLDKRRE